MAASDALQRALRAFGHQIMAGLGLNVTSPGESGPVQPGVGTLGADWVGIRYFALDYDAGSDDAIGFSDVSLAAAGVAPLKTFEELLTRIPVNGLGQTVMIGVKPRAGGAPYRNKTNTADDDLDLRGFSGYKQILFRGTLDFSNDPDDKKQVGGILATGTNPAGYALTPTSIPAANMRDVGISVASTDGGFPDLVTTTVPHGYGFQQKIILSGVAGDTAADGTFYVNPMSPTTFLLFYDSELGLPVTGTGLGVGGNSSPLTSPLAGSTYTPGRIQLTTDAPHGLTTGDMIIVEGLVNGTVEAGGLWRVTVLDATNFTLDGSRFRTPYAGGGTIETWHAIPALPFGALPVGGLPTTGLRLRETTTGVMSGIWAVADNGLTLIPTGSTTEVIAGTYLIEQAGVALGAILAGQADSSPRVNAAPFPEGTALIGLSASVIEVGPSANIETSFLQAQQAIVTGSFKSSQQYLDTDGSFPDVGVGCRMEGRLRTNNARVIDLQSFFSLSTLVGLGSLISSAGEITIGDGCFFRRSYAFPFASPALTIDIGPAPRTFIGPTPDPVQTITLRRLRIDGQIYLFGDGGVLRNITMRDSGSNLEPLIKIFNGDWTLGASVRTFEGTLLPATVVGSELAGAGLHVESTNIQVRVDMSPSDFANPPDPPQPSLGVAYVQITNGLDAPSPHFGLRDIMIGLNNPSTAGRDPLYAWDDLRYAAIKSPQNVIIAPTRVRLEGGLRLFAQTPMPGNIANQMRGAAADPLGALTGVIPRYSIVATTPPVSSLTGADIYRIYQAQALPPGAAQQMSAIAGVIQSDGWAFISGINTDRRMPTISDGPTWIKLLGDTPNPSASTIAYLSDIIPGYAQVFPAPTIKQKLGRIIGSTRNHIDPALSRAIDSTTATSPVVVTTIGPHHLASGTKIQIIGVIGGTANGTRFIKVLSPITFELYTDADFATPVASGVIGVGGTLYTLSSLPFYVLINFDPELLPSTAFPEAQLKFTGSVVDPTPPGAYLADSGSGSVAGLTLPSAQNYRFATPRIITNIAVQVNDNAAGFANGTTVTLLRNGIPTALVVVIAGAGDQGVISAPEAFLAGDHYDILVTPPGALIGLLSLSVNLDLSRSL